MGPVSFISEHTAEYALVHNLVSILSRHYRTVIPVYFWVAREGSLMASRSVGDQHVLVVTAYARRPKVLDPGDTVVLMKINALLLRAGATGIDLGSPVFAGVPLVTGLLQFALDIPCSWFHIGEDSVQGEDIEIEVSVTGEQHRGNTTTGGVIGPLNPEDIARIVRGRARAMPWDMAVDCIRCVRSSGEIGMRGPFYSGYRPFFLILPVEDMREPA